MDRAGSYLNDLVEYDINGSSWKDLSPMSAGVAPSVRANMGFEEWNGKLYLFGGQNGIAWPPDCFQSPSPSQPTCCP